MTTRTTFDPAHKGSLVTLTNGNRDMVLADQQQTARITVGRDAAASGVVCFELVRLASGSFANVPSVGLILEGQPYDGSGLTGYAVGSGRDGWSITDSAFAATAYHSAVPTGLPPTVMGGVGTSVIALGCVHDVAAGTLKIYAVRSMGNGPPILCHTLSGLPTSGIFYPTLGWGNIGSTTEKYRWNGGQDAVQPNDGPDWRPVDSLMWDESFPPPPLPDPLPRTTTLIQDRHVAGAHALAQISDTVVAVAAYNRLQRVVFDPTTGIAALDTSLTLDYQLGDIAKVDTVLMGLGTDGYLHKFSTAPAETGSVAVKAKYPWIAVTGNFAIVHASGGQIGVYNPSLAKLAQHPTGLGDVVYATADSAGNVYAFDGRGRGALLIVNLSTGALEFSTKFTAANAVGVRAAFVDEDAEELVIGCSAQARVIVMNTATMGVTSSTMNAGKKLVGLVIGDPERRAIFETGNTEVFPDSELPLTAALTVAEDEVFFASSKMSAVGLYRTLLEE